MPKVPKIASLWYFYNISKENEVDFMYAEKHQTFQQVYTINLDGHEACPYYTKYQVCEVIFQSFAFLGKVG